jgi:hypothetical protein
MNQSDRKTVNSYATIGGEIETILDEKGGLDGYPLSSMRKEAKSAFRDENLRRGYFAR